MPVDQAPIPMHLAWQHGSASPSVSVALVWGTFFGAKREHMQCRQLGNQASQASSTMSRPYLTRASIIAHVIVRAARRKSARVRRIRQIALEDMNTRQDTDVVVSGCSEWRRL